jgi:hypothetical protein
MYTKTEKNEMPHKNDAPRVGLNDFANFSEPLMQLLSIAANQVQYLHRPWMHAYVAWHLLRQRLALM